MTHPKHGQDAHAPEKTNFVLNMYTKRGWAAFNAIHPLSISKPYQTTFNPTICRHHNCADPTEKG